MRPEYRGERNADHVYGCGGYAAVLPIYKHPATLSGYRYSGQTGFILRIVRLYVGRGSVKPSWDVRDDAAMVVTTTFGHNDSNVA